MQQGRGLTGVPPHWASSYTSLLQRGGQVAMQRPLGVKLALLQPGRAPPPPRHQPTLFSPLLCHRYHQRRCHPRGGHGWPRHPRGGDLPLFLQQQQRGAAGGPRARYTPPQEQQNKEGMNNGEGGMATGGIVGSVWPPAGSHHEGETLSVPQFGGGKEESDRTKLVHLITVNEAGSFRESTLTRADLSRELRTVPKVAIIAITYQAAFNTLTLSHRNTTHLA